MVRDRYRLHSRLRGIEAAIRAGKPADESLSRLEHDIRRSRERFEQRLGRLPKPTFPPELPVSERRQQIAELISGNQVVVICGETGSGKTTQLPKICLQLGRGVGGLIGHTQPRRIAARSVASRIAQELNSPVGQQVGYKVRFGDKVSQETCIKLMTDGILLAETQHDRYLENYDTIIIDEAHERSLNIDFLLGYLKQLLPKRPDLKLIITSATIDPVRFSRHFDDAPILEVSGRTYPVEVRYRPPASSDDEEDPDPIESIMSAIDEVWREGAGDILLFLSGEREIRETAEALRQHHPPGVEILPLYARLSADEQMKVFAPHAQPRIVLATNVAETSLTVPGIKYVIDPGFARISRYAPRTRVSRLPVERISQASANQRAGRCGRISSGIAIRLYSEEDFAARAQICRSGNPAHEPRQCDPSDEGAAAGGHPGFSLRGAAGLPDGAGWAGDAARAWRNRRGQCDHAPRAGSGQAADRSAAGAHGGRSGTRGMPAAGADHCGSPLHPGPARTPAR